MNLMLIERADDCIILPAQDARAAHIREVLHMKAGDIFDVGAVDGPRGKAKISSDDERGMSLSITWGELPRPSLPLELVIGLSRPQTMRKILREAPALGVSAIHIARCVRSEPAYAESSLWTSGEWSELLRLGTEQAFTTRVPKLVHHDSLKVAIETMTAGCESLALDNYEATIPLAQWTCAPDKRIVLCIGPERGWDASERNVLRDHGYTLAHLGPLVLRTETAMIAGVALVAAACGQWNDMHG